MLELNDLRFAYPDGPAFAFSMQAQRGVVTAIRGRSGAGKSTLLDLVAGFLRPQGGTLTLDGTDISPLPPERRPVSILFQSESVFDHLSAAANIALARRPPPSAAEIAQALASVGLAGIEYQRAATLSGGQKQRVALARTLLLNRQVLLLDEPFSALDDENRTTLRTLVRDLSATHQWITILVTHHVEDIRAIAAASYLLADGRLTPES